MKKIKDNIYEKLTVRQRIIASIEAMARDDKDEKFHLFQSCPRFEYKMNDLQFSSKLDALQELALVVENDLRGCLLDFFLESFLHKAGAADFSTLPAGITKFPEIIQDMLSIREAWHKFLSEEGISLSIMEAAHKDLPHDLIGLFVQAGENLGLLPDEYATGVYKNLLRNYYDNSV